MTTLGTWYSPSSGTGSFLALANPPFAMTTTFTETIPPPPDQFRPRDRWIGPHMPRWASRITLEVRSVKVERLQDISGPDCWAEGIEHAGWDCERYGSVVECYRDLWQSINGADSWDANPWVWVVEFQRIEVAS